MYKDCRFDFKKGLLTIQNSCIKRTMLICDEGMIPLGLYDEQTGKAWQRTYEDNLLIAAPFSDTKVTVWGEVEDHFGLSDEHLAVHVCWHNERLERFEKIFEIYPELPWIHMRCEVCSEKSIEMQTQAVTKYKGIEGAYKAESSKNIADFDAIDILMLPKGHYRLHEVNFIDQSDGNNTLVRESARPLYTQGFGEEKGVGHLFTIEDTVDGQAVMLVKESPAFYSKLGNNTCDFYIKDNKAVYLTGTGLEGQELSREGVFAYGSTVGVGAIDEMKENWRKLYRAMWHGEEQIRVFSNTWGDRSQDRAVCHDFMMEEIHMASKLGVQVVQIDDGWQIGHSGNSAQDGPRLWERYYDQNPNFWQVNTLKFPQGLAPLAEEAKKYNIELGLWFSPDSYNYFENWEKDAEVLLGFYKKYGIRRFKLDAITLGSKLSERNYLRFLEKINKESHGRICVNQDITADVRMGHLYYREYGNLFVENRYTDFGSYYPYCTLKSLWQLSHYIPAGRLQIECLNNARNKDKYPKDDMFAPALHSIDYIFAVAMVANPLLWMEMSHLEKKDAMKLKEIIEVWHRHSKAFIDADICPIGQMPSGQSFTGFNIKQSKNEGYLLLFREVSKNVAFDYVIPQFDGKEYDFEVIKSNGDIELLQQKGGVLNVKIEQPRTYALVKYTASKFI